MTEEVKKNSWIKVSIIVAVLIVTFLVCIKISDILCSLLLAFIVAYIFSPFIDVLEKMKISRAVGVFLTLCLFILIICSIILYILPRAISELTYLANKLPEFQNYVITLFTKLESIKIPEEIQSIFNELTKRTKDGLSGIAQDIPIMGIELLKGLFLNTISLLSYILNFIIFGVVTIYLLKDFDKIKKWILAVTPYKYKNNLINISTKIDSNLKIFFRGQLIVCLILVFIYTSGLAILGVNSALLIGLIGGFSNLIPYFGLFMGMIPAIILSLIEFQNIFHLLGVISIFLMGQFAEGILITPKVIGERMGINPILIIISIMIFGRLFGVFGVLFAVPLVAILKVVGEMLMEQYKYSKFYSNSTKDKNIRAGRDRRFIKRRFYKNSKETNR
ncbi:MAG: AI-2E family transporter [bacterium]|nr:AI-2E family transporter [bacterium]